jgi:hypothetical protein
MGQGFHNASLMCNLPHRLLLKLGSLCPKPFTRSWILVACGSVLKDLNATAPSKSERDWLEQSQRPPELEITVVIDIDIYGMEQNGRLLL